jgi:hypothetical protein
MRKYLKKQGLCLDVVTAKEKKLKKMDKKICGIEIEKIRKAYFTNKIPKLLVDIQASGISNKEELEILKKFLTSLRKEDEILNSEFVSFLPKVDYEDSVLDELNNESLSEIELEELNREKSNREAAVKHANHILKGIFMKYRDPNQKTPDDSELMDISFELLSLEYYIMRDCIYKERIYRKKIVEYERQGKQRKLAEELAKTTIAYRDFALAEKLMEMIKEFIMLAKKKYREIL